MSRKQERILVRIMGIWQIIDGLITVIYYGFFQQGHGFIGISESVYPSGYMIVVSTFGVFLIGLGLFNLILSYRYIKDNQMYRGIGVFLIIQAITLYFLLDLVSVVLSIAAGVILLSKNKGLRLATKC